MIESFTARIGPRDRLRGTLVLRRAWANSQGDTLYSANFDMLGRRDLATFAAEAAGRWSGSFASICQSPQPPFFCPLQYNSTAGTGLEMRLGGTGATITGEFRFEDEYSPTVVPVIGERRGHEIVFTSPSKFNFRDCRFVLNEWAGMTGTCSISFYPFSREDLDVFQMLKMPE